MRKVFIVVAGGNFSAERHFEDTIQRKRTLGEVKSFLPQKEIDNLSNIYNSASFIVWGAVPGKMNESNWEKMEPGDVVLVYNKGYIRFVGEVGAKVRSKDLARYFWRETEAGETWELIYFILNEERVNVPLEKLNPYLGYQRNFSPRGFMMVNSEAVLNFAKNYGDILGALKTLEKGDDLIQIPERSQIVYEEVGEKIERATTEHDEMQWRLIRLGKLAKFDIWIPRNDQGKVYDGSKFEDFVLPEFHPTLDVPLTIRNIDVVWKFGPYSIISAFEIEHSTSVYSGILRLSDLRAGNPNSNYPLYIVAPEERKRKVFEELSRPTFSSECLKLNEVVGFLGYRDIREIDESYKNAKEFDPKVLFNLSAKIKINE